MNAILFDKTNKLRSGWRAAIFCLAFLFTVVPLSLVAEMIAGAYGLERRVDSPGFLALNGIVSIIPAILVAWLCGRFLESLPFRALGAAAVGRWWLNWLVGCAIGALTFLVAIVPAAMSGNLRFAQGPAPSIATLASAALTSFVILAVASAFEEALFRGYLFQTFTRSGLTWLAVALTSVGFALVHVMNPDATLLSTINTGIAGLWFAVAYLKTRDLWFVWGVHLLWNWTQGSVFGIEISGLKDLTPVSVFKEIDAGPAWLTGANYGIEGSIGATAAIVLSIAAIHFIPWLKPLPEPELKRPVS